MIVYFSAFLPYEALNRANALVKAGATVPDRSISLETVRNPSPMAFYFGVLKGGPSVLSGDTLVVGDSPAETLRVSGTWSHSGPIFVVNDGVLILDGANATIDGNIFVLNRGKVIVDSSFLYFPQRFNYQYGYIIADEGEMIITNSETFFNGFTFGVAVVDSARFVERYVRNRDFTTFGGYGEAPYIEVERTDNVGEIVVGRKGRYVVRHSDTLLLWHRFPPGSVADITFPSYSDTVLHYTFDSTLSSVSGIEYSVLIDTTTGIMWGMMVEDSSNVTVSNSYVRSVGIFFRGSDTLSISGITNGATYTSYTVPVPDRYLHFNNSYVNTFSLYPMDSTVIYARGCIVGEALPLMNSHLEITNSYVDGSGGYLGSTESAFNLAAFTSITTNLQSSGNSILVFAYSAQAGFLGQVVASESSIMVIAQSSTLEYPEVHDHAFAWVSNIKAPAYAPVGASITVRGDAYGEAGPLGSFLRFSSYSLYYQRAGDSVWVPIATDITTPVKDGVLAVWDTEGLLPGTYFLKLKTTVSTGDSISVLKAINLGTMEASERARASGSLKVSGTTVYYPGRYSIYSPSGRLIFSGEGRVRLKRGVYFARVGGRSVRVVLR